MFTFIVLKCEVGVHWQVLVKKEVKPWSIGKVILISGTDSMNNLGKRQILNNKFNVGLFPCHYAISFSIVKKTLKEPLLIQVFKT